MIVTPLFSVFIPGEVPSSKNSKQWTGKFLVSSKATRRWTKETAWYWEQYASSFRLALADLTPPYCIEFGFKRKTKGTYDYVNAIQAVCDAMREPEYGWLLDDDIKNIKPYFEDSVYDKINPGVTITVLREKPKHRLPIIPILNQIIKVRNKIKNNEPDWEQELKLVYDTLKNSK